MEGSVNIMLDKTKGFFKTKFTTKWKVATIVAFFVLSDVFSMLNDYNHNRFIEYENRIVYLEETLEESVNERDAKIKIHKENEVLYQDTLFIIAKKLYEKEQFMTGGVEIPAEVSTEVLLEAINNTVADFRDVLNAVENYYNGRDKILSSIPCIWPIEHSPMARVTSGFGFRISPITGKVILHRALDITGGEIDPKRNRYTAPKVIAAADGIVTTHYLPPGWHNGRYYKGYIDEDGDDFGAYVVIEHGAYNNEGIFIPNGYVTIYAHMDNTQKYVKEGEFKNQGEPVGEMGSTGNSTGIHVHYELKKNGIHVDPIDYLVSMRIDDGKEIALK
jgi:murein DD-endopeptidase MepM/ murein hydrolase activator NlpD